MTLKVDLLPTEPRRSRLDGPTLLLAGLVLAANLGFVLHAADLERQVRDEKAALDRTEAEIRQLESSLPRLDDMKTEIARLQEQVRAVSRLSTDAVRHAELLAEVGRVLPADAWLSSLALEPATGRLVLNGTSAGRPPLATVGRLIANLEDSPRLGDATLTSVSRGSEADSYSFALEASYTQEERLPALQGEGAR